MSCPSTASSRPRLRALPAALCAACFALPLPSAAAASDESESAEPSLPAIEVRGERQRRAPHDPRPGKLRSATRSDSDPAEVPQTIQSVNVAQVLSYGGRSLAAALAGVPGVSNISDTRFDAFRIRGFSSAGDVLLDGMRDDAQYLRGLGNIERVEILKGPAAVLYGRGSGGGVINRISKQPERDAYVQASASIGSASAIGAALDWNHPLDEQWALRINTGRDYASSFRDHVNGARQYLSPALKWQSGRHSWLLQLDYDEYARVPDRGMPAQVTALSASRRALAYGLPPAGDERFYGAAGRDVIRDATLSVRSTLERAVSERWTLRHALSLLDLNSDFDNTFVSQAYTDKPFDLGRVQRSRFLQNLQQRNLQSNLEVQGQWRDSGMSHDLLLGSELAWQKREPRLAMAAVPPVSLFTPDPSALASTAPQPWQRNYHRARNLGLYAQDQIGLGAQWKLLAGVRWDRFAIDSRNQLLGLSSQRTSVAVSPRLGAVWEALPGQHLYSSYSKNFAPVGGDLIGITPGARGNLTQLDPQYSRQVETGLKSDWLDGKLNTTLAWFQLDLYNRNVADPVKPGVFYQTGLERNRGVEFSVQGELARHWFLRAGLGQQNARVLRAEPAMLGKRPAGVSARNGSVFISYAPPLGWFADTGLIHEGARYADRDNLLQLPAYTRWDGQLGYRLPSSQYTLAATNLANRRYHASATGVTQVMPGAPRSLMLTASYRF